jgi:hypothetical protein
MSKATTITSLQQRYFAAMPGVQTGVAYMMQIEPKQVGPKHLRTGINSAMVNDAALTKLLIAKGIITEEEYWHALVEEAEAERARYEEQLSAHYGRKIILG